MKIEEYIYHIEKDIQETRDSQFQNILRICLYVIQVNLPKKSKLSQTVKEPFNISPPTEKEFLWDKEILDAPSGRDLDIVHKLGFSNIVGMIKGTPRKNVYITETKETIAFSRSKYSTEFSNEGPMVGKDNDEIEVFNKCDWWLIARYTPDIKDYKDYAVFDCRNITVGNINGDISFTSPHPDGSQIINKDTWFKVLGLQRREG